jgi:cytochrome c5
MHVSSMLRILPGITAVLIATGCGSPPQNATDAATANPAATTAMTPSDNLLLASAKSALPPPLSPDSLPDPSSAGARELASFCTTCHNLPSPAMHSATDWPGVARRMWLRMGLLDPSWNIRVPDLGERIIMLDYLTANALRVSHATLPDRPGRAEFETTCAQCHELPDPQQHSSADWFVVVRRMNDHMRTILGKELPAATIEQITGYLTASRS